MKFIITYKYKEEHKPTTVEIEDVLGLGFWLNYISTTSLCAWKIEFIRFLDYSYDCIMIEGIVLGEYNLEAL